MKYFTYFVQKRMNPNFKGPFGWLINLGSNVLQNVIQWYQCGDDDIHAGVVLNFQASDFNPACPLVLEATWPKIRQGYSCGKFKYYSIPITDEQAAALPGIVDKYLGDDYDYRGLVSFILREDTTEGNKYYCSELVMKVAGDLGIQIFTPICLPRYVYPAMLKFSPIPIEGTKIAA
jgi:hypothetical protein